MRRSYLLFGSLIIFSIITFLFFKKRNKLNNSSYANKKIYKDTFVLGYGKDHKLLGSKWGIGFFPKIHVLDRLVEYNMSSDSFIPALAESWEIKNGGKEIVFHLKKGIKFSNGKEVNAQAVKFTMDRLIAKNHSLAPLGCKVIDNYTLVIYYKNPGFFNLAKMAEFHLSIMSPNSVTPPENPNGTLVKPIGSGPFEVSDYKKDKFALYTPNKFWYKEHNSRPKFKKFLVKVIPDESTRIMALKSGEVDAISDYIHGGSAYTPRNQLSLLRKKGFKVYKKNVPITWIIAFNYKKPPFDDPEVRKAISLAINRNDIIKIFNNEVRPAWNGMFAPEVPGMKEANITYKYDPDLARHILEKKGLIGKKITFIVDKAQEDQILVAQLIQDELKKIGFKVKLEVLESGAYKQKRDTGDYNLRFYYIGGTNRRFYLRLYWRFYPGCKWAAYQSEKVCKLCKKILEDPKDLDSNVRKQDLIAFYRVLYKEMGVVPLYHDIMTVVTNPNVVVSKNLFTISGEPFFAEVGVKLQ